MHGGSDFKDQAGKLKAKFGTRLEAPCTKVVDGAKKCRTDGAGNISGHGQSVIDVCKAVKGIDAKLEPQRVVIRALRTAGLGAGRGRSPC